MSDLFTFVVDYSKTALRVEPLPPWKTTDLFDYSSPLIKNNKFVKAKGKNLYDFLPFNDSLGYLVSEKVKQIVEDNGLTGLDFFPVELIDINRSYYGPIYTADCGTDAGFKYTNGGLPRIFDYNPQNWDGSDFFVFKGTLVKVCSERVKLLFEKNKVTKLRFTKINLV